MIDIEQLKKLKYLRIKYKDKKIVIVIEDKILDINSNENTKNIFIEINDNRIKNFYKLNNFDGDFNEEMRNEIKKQGTNFICDILLTIKGSGFFCQISYNNENINVLFTNNHVINKDLLSIGQKIRLIYKGNYKDIEIKKNRLIWTDSRNYDEGLDYTCIQILKEDGFNIKNIFQIYDSNISDYNGIAICILQYPKGEELTVETGYIKNLNNYKIFHSANTEGGSSGSPIICLENYKVIGIHRRYNKTKKLNFGSFIKYILLHIECDNFIICDYNIKESDIGKEIQIINNTNFLGEKATCVRWNG